MFLDLPILIQARTGSKRFPEKVLADFNGQSIVWNVYSTCTEVSKNVFVIGHSKDAKLFTHCKEYGINMVAVDVPENDLIKRYAVASAKIGGAGFLRVTADCPLMFPQELLWVGMTALKGGYDFVCNDDPKHRTTPDGVDCEYYSSGLIQWMNNNISDLKHREHLPLYLYENFEKDNKLLIFNRCETHWPVNMSKLKFSIDTPEDLERAKEGKYL